MNILLTCAGRRNYLIDYFRQALSGDGRVMATDASADAPAMQEADQAFVVPNVNDPGYIPSLLDICREHHVGLLVSLNDLELPVLGRERTKFQDIGTYPVVSEPEVIETAFDKARTLEFLHSCNLRGPMTALDLPEAIEKLDAGEMRFPLVVKPRWGTASIGIETVYNREDLDLAFRLAHKRLERTIIAQASTHDRRRAVMIQECLVGEEYGLDVVNDLNGNYVVTWVKKKLAMRAGETDRAITIDNETLRSLGRVLGTRLKHVGNLDCDVFLTQEGPVVLEMNPRFGGGYPFSHEAGANLPAALIAWAEGHDQNPAWLTIAYDVCVAKCDRLVRKKL